MCPDEGLLQAFLDGELDTGGAARVAGHLAECAACRRRFQELEALAASVTATLQAYEGTARAAVPRWPPPSPGSPGRRERPLPSDQLLPNHTVRRRIPDMIRRHKWVSAAAVAALGLTAFLSWAPGRSLAAQLLNIFRMEKIQVIRITPEDMIQLENLLKNQEGEVAIQNFGRVEVKRSTEGSVRVDPAQVEALSGVKLNLPATLAGRERVHIWVDPAPTVIFTPDVEKLNAYLRKHGGTLLPENLAGQSFTLRVPPLVRADYGRPGNGFTVYAARELTIDAPKGVNPDALRQALLNLPFLPENLRRQLAAIEDWQHTLPIPDTQGMRARGITVNGNQGVYFSSTAGADHPGGETPEDGVILAWRQGDSWRAISGLSLKEALRVAAEVK